MIETIGCFIAFLALAYFVICPVFTRERKYQSDRCADCHERKRMYAYSGRLLCGECYQYASAMDHWDERQKRDI